MSMASPLLLIGLISGGLCLAGILTLRRSWKKAGPARPIRILVGWVLLTLSVLASVALSQMAPGRSPAWGSAVALSLAAGLALCVILAGAEWRKPRADGHKRRPQSRSQSRAQDEVDLALEPSDRTRRAWRGWLRAALAGPFAGLAALGLGLFIVMWAPGAVQTRMVIGGMLVPFLWAGGMAWTLSDDRILRATAVLLGTAVLSLSAAFLRGPLL
ncbi:MAG: hypothetical protein ACK41P_03010 [Asticcacaulis sp.]